MLPTTRWKLPHTNEMVQSMLAREIGISPIISQILVNRGITTPDDAKRFLFPSLNQLHNPFLMQDMEHAVDRLIAAIFKNEKIVVYGDYDADGITSTAVLVKFLREIHDRISYYIPQRIGEGYGLSTTAIDGFREEGIDLIVTVDCGISDHEAIAHATRAGIDVIVTDHHEVPATLPHCKAVINPHRPDCPFPFKSLAGVGVVFNLLIALRGKLRNQGFWEGKEYPNLMKYLDLVAIGTIGDIVPLVDENRILAKIGLGVAGNTDRIGLRALMAVSDMGRRVISSEMAAFRLIPRINAAGRIGVPGDAVELLLTEDEGRAALLAERLDAYNKNRQEIEKKILHEILEEINTTTDINKGNSLVLSSDSWHPGVIGIVASKLVDRYYRPTVLISVQDGIGRGSGRSIVEFNLYEGLDTKCSSLLLSYGGHRYAAGISIREENISRFSEILDETVRESIGSERVAPQTTIDALCTLNDVDYSLLSQIEMMAPFGNMNPEPVLHTRDVRIESPTTVGKNHLKMRANSNNMSCDSIWFDRGDLLEQLAGSTIDIVFSPQINHWNGKSSIQLKMKDASFPS